MRVYVFNSVSFPDVSAFTVDATGGNLPAEYALWLPASEAVVMLNRVESDPIIVAIKRDGYFVVDDKRPTPTAPPTQSRP